MKKYPKSFDLAYNKALLLYNIAQDKRIVSQLGALLDVLKEALDAHRYAYALDQENADVLFNTAQVLTSFAEELNDEADENDDVKTQAVSLLQEAVELFNSCLTRQEMEYSEMQELMQEANDGVPLGQSAIPVQPAASPSEEGSGEWATVREPVTPNTLLETALAQLGSLSSLATIASPTTSSLLANLGEIAAPLIHQKLPAYTALLPTSVAVDPRDDKSTPFLSISAAASTFHATQGNQDVTNPQAAAKAEADLAVAVFTAALAAAEYESRLSETHQYQQRLQGAFAGLSQSIALGLYPDSAQVPIFSAYADALIEFAENVSGMYVQDVKQDDALAARWTALEEAQKLLTQATSKIGNAVASDGGAPSKAQLYFTRGNVELLRRRLTLHASASPTLQKNTKTLLKNAGVYYRGAAGLAKQDGDADLEADAMLRNRIVQGLEQEVVKEAVEGLRAWVVREGGQDALARLEEMVEEGLVGGED